MHIATYYKENIDGPRAEIVEGNLGYYVKYYDANGFLLKEERFPGKSIHYVKDAAQNWVDGIKNLNG